MLGGIGGELVDDEAEAHRGVKVIGPDFDVIAKLVPEIVAALKTVPGTSSVFAERIIARSHRNAPGLPRPWSLFRHQGRKRSQSTR